MKDEHDRGQSGHEFVVRSEVIEWRGPSPYHFVLIDGDEAEAIRHQSTAVTYGWGMIPVDCLVGETSFSTALWPKDGAYFLPLKDKVRGAESIELGQFLEVRFSLRRSTS